ncbi:hypothetical protein P3T76_009245 [Phytophthora citrophthora]|uniref:Uncharacterized protein n=1 Tax=Phytophthora citrophthora TaxID=4793 RepID=A0AAD9GGD9_9STRA|nr:hypothetical protein P3T76_009245 [Phytophthora citrophthora]
METFYYSEKSSEDSLRYAPVTFLSVVADSVSESLDKRKTKEFGCSGILKSIPSLLRNEFIP